MIRSLFSALVVLILLAPTPSARAFPEVLVVYDTVDANTQALEAALAALPD